MKSANVGDHRIRRIESDVFLLEELNVTGNPACGVTQWQEIGKFSNLKSAAEYLSKQEV